MDTLCMCGCGCTTKPSMITNKNLGYKKGEPNKYIKGHNKPWLGLKRGKTSEETKIRQRYGHLGKKYNTTEEGREISRKNLFKAHSPESRMKTSLKLRGRKQTPEHIKNAMRRRSITSLELKFDKIAKELNLPYKFVGNGDFIIDGLNPDFINTNGEKIAIEVYARMFKNIGERSVEKYKNDRISRLSTYGWQVYFFDETQVNTENILNTLGGDHH